MEIKKIKRVLSIALALFILVLPITIEGQDVAGKLTSFMEKIKSLAGNLEDALLAAALAAIGVGFAISAIFFLSAGGSPETLGKAKQAFFWSVVGTIVYMIATAGLSWVRTLTGG